eukprot:TRINITY_DN3383_c0_g1_i1.p1 TRINITY_DN3383_c0_g1~~TRINITY_DN3383_c0_g1_i1.p1  ORF type:complete len:359 (-),score=-3.59 TRINITY_DN3383_c0_g1_i1:291-1238(-)
MLTKNSVGNIGQIAVSERNNLNQQAVHEGHRDKRFSKNMRVNDVQICYDFTKNQCSRGDRCKYSHDIATIIGYNSQEKGICFDFLRGQCMRGMLCKFSHDLSNIAHLQQQTFCGSVGNRSSSSICYNFLKGTCQKGNTCKYSHDLTVVTTQSRNLRHSSVQNGKSSLKRIKSKTTTDDNFETLMRFSQIHSLLAEEIIRQKQNDLMFCRSLLPQHLDKQLADDFTISYANEAHAQAQLASCTSMGTMDNSLNFVDGCDKSLIEVKQDSIKLSQPSQPTLRFSNQLFDNQLNKICNSNQSNKIYDAIQSIWNSSEF